MRDLCTATPILPLERSRTGRAAEPLDQWEVVGSYYTPSQPPVRSTGPATSTTANEASAAAAATTAIGLVTDEDNGDTVGAASSTLAETGRAPSLDRGSNPPAASALPTQPQQPRPSSPAPALPAAVLMDRLSARVALRLLQVIADFGRHPEHGALLRQRLQRDGVLEALLDIIQTSGITAVADTALASLLVLLANAPDLRTGLGMATISLPAPVQRSTSIPCIDLAGGGRGAGGVRFSDGTAAGSPLDRASILGMHAQSVGSLSSAPLSPEPPHS